MGDSIEKDNSTEESEGKTDEEILSNIYDPDTKKMAMEWLSEQKRRSDHWDKVSAGGNAPDFEFRGDSPADHHTLGSYENVTGSRLESTSAYRKAQDLASQSKDPELMGSYIWLALASELSQRLRDGRVVLMGMHPRWGPILASAGTHAKREKEFKNSSVKH